MDINIIYYNILYHMTHLQQETSFTSTVQEPKKVGLFVRADEKLIKKLKETFPDAFEGHIRAALERYAYSQYSVQYQQQSTSHGDTSYSGTKY